ncbi:MAG: PTS system mannose/fructose/sorbose family transporter subunit IID [Erysipelotrichaceae bacterium]|nr:PTS system mannose/fructose/sorbose family transporter subunit IID [Erysipelotrichaceae bacterium]
MAEKKLTRGDLIKTFLLWETQTEVCLSYERLMSLGFCISMAPVINRLYETKEERAEAMKRHLVFFNTENNWGAFIPGLVASMEEDRANGAPITDDLINNVKIGLMGPLAGLGDTITQGLVKVVLLAIFVNMALDGYTIAPVLFFLFYGAYITAIGVFTFYEGYHVGKNVLDKITDSEIIHKITDCLGLIGMTIAGAMIITNVGIETPFVVQDVAIQDILNDIAPNLLGVVTTLGIFYFLRKGTPVSKIIIALFVIGFACYFLGIL